MNALEQELKSQLPRPQASASLHASIMRAVRASNRAAAAENRPLWPRWIPVSGVALLSILAVCLAVLFASHPAARRQPAVASSALELGGTLMRQAPEAAISPLNDEMQKLDHDLSNVKEFLMASLP
jgi:hypothetical protein